MIVLIALFVLLFALVVMVGVPILNAYLLAGSGVNPGNLSNWQFTANITVVGMLVTGVFVITSLRMEHSAKYTAWHEVHDLIQRYFVEICRPVGDALKLLFEKEEESHQALRDEERGSHQALRTKQEQFYRGQRIVQEQIHRELRTEHKQSNERVREFIDSQASQQVDALRDDEVMESIRETVSAMIQDQAARQLLFKALWEHMAENPDDAIVDHLAEKVAAKARWRWLFRTRRNGGSTKQDESAS